MAMRETVSVVVTDLDNTLFDWVEIWYRSFSAMLVHLQQASGLPVERLLDDVRSVHRRHGTSEYAFLVEELTCLYDVAPASERARIITGANKARSVARNAATRLYPRVRETLRELQRRGVLVIGYTESTSFYTVRRARRLGLDGLLNILYSPPDHAFPHLLTREEVRRHPPEHYQFSGTVHYHTPPHELKPNPQLLLDILHSAGATPTQAVYVGDSPMKDITMAQDAGVRDVLALYGKAQDREAYELLRSVTHWSEEDVAREKEILARGEVTPTFVLRHSFSELLQLFSFSPFPDRPRVVASV
jgi:phosphoglycolate phosphatase